MRQTRRCRGSPGEEPKEDGVQQLGVPRTNASFGHNARTYANAGTRDQPAGVRALSCPDLCQKFV